MGKPNRYHLALFGVYVGTEVLYITWDYDVIHIQGYRESAEQVRYDNMQNIFQDKTGSGHLKFLYTVSLF